MIGGEEFLSWLGSRRSCREFSDAPVVREVLQRIVQAGTTAPSAGNRQPWRFAVVTCSALQEEITSQVRDRSAELEALVKQGHHGEGFAAYGDFFWQPLASARALIIPQFREHPDALARLIASGGANPEAMALPSQMQPERCATSAALMAILLQAKAEGLGAIWMAGPMVARHDIEALLDIRAPWQMLGAVALGHPCPQDDSQDHSHVPTRKPEDRIVRWHEGQPRTMP